MGGFVPGEPVRQLGVATMLPETIQLHDFFKDCCLLIIRAEWQIPSVGNLWNVFLKYAGMYITLHLKHIQPAFFMCVILSSAKRPFVQTP